MPTGFLEDAVDVGYGGTIEANYSFIYSNLEAALSFGYLYCGYKENLPQYDFSFSSIPILIGIKFNLTDFDFIPYLGLETGIFFNDYFVEVDDGALGKIQFVTHEYHLGIAPYLGFRMNLSQFFDLDVTAKYNRLKNKYIARSFVLVQTGFAYRF